MSRLIPLTFLLALVGCALFLVHTQSHTRHLFIELERSQSQARQIEIDWSQLRLDQSTLGKHERIDMIARKDLGMTPLTAARTQYLTQGAK
jgi:cell division protein FtsL